MENTNIIIEFAKTLENNPDNAYDFISRNYYKMTASKLAAVAKELIYAIYENCDDATSKQLFSDVAAELNEQHKE